MAILKRGGRKPRSERTKTKPQAAAEGPDGSGGSVGLFQNGRTHSILKEKVAAVDGFSIFNLPSSDYVENGVYTVRVLLTSDWDMYGESEDFRFA